MNPLKVTKVVVGVVSSVGADLIITKAVKLIAPSSSKIARGAMWVGGMFMGMMVGDRVGDYAEGLVETVAVRVKEISDNLTGMKNQTEK